ncbi:MAG: hypothetical protein ACRDHE_13815, partial [Ktedonobacterales bacterium]
MLTHTARRHTLAALALLAMALALPACHSSQVVIHPSATATRPSTSPTPLPTQPVNQRPSPVAGLLGPAPTNCASSAPPSTLHTTNFGGGFGEGTSFQGSAPAWDFGLPTTLQLEQAGNDPYPSAK